MTQRFNAIHQFHSGATPGDAITNQMFVLQAELRALGYPSEIFAEHFDGELATSIKHIDSLKPSPHELLLIHHSMGHRRLDQILALPNPIITVYHNITPAQELTDVGYKHFSHIGRNQLDVLAEQSLMGIADSHYNRKEMLLRGFKKVEVIPVRTDFREFFSARQHRHPERDWLFVGRIAPNKQQLEIIKAFHHFHHNVEKSARLYLVGDHKMRSYVDAVGDEIEKLGMIPFIDAPGKLEDVDLIHRYARAGVFISLSTHEGFGVPLLEAMASGIPVVALESSAVTETMGGAGVLLTASDPITVSNAVQRLMTDDGYRQDIIWKQDRRLEKLTRFDTRKALVRILKQLNGEEHRTRIQIQGPIESSYSLAILNRETAFQLASHQSLEVSVYPTEGPGDYAPNQDWLSQIGGLREMYERGLHTPYPDVVIRQMFPPRVKDTTATTTLQYFGWEESLVPNQFVSDFNEHVHRIMTMSTFVKHALIDSGVTIPIDVVGVGVRQPTVSNDFEIEELSQLKNVRFLHISSAFPRKGIDLLLDVYFSEFNGNDDVSLILKTFPNQHNTVSEQLDRLQSTTANPPHVVWIDRDLPVEALGNLYKEASAYVHPARGEGFGLPVAEAMLARIPVISTDTSGLADFVNESTAAVIPSVKVAANSHVSVPGSQWFEPDSQTLRTEMRNMTDDTYSGLRQERVENAWKLISENFSWEAVGSRIKASIEAARGEQFSINIAHLTTFNSRCGIAEYSSLLLDGLPKNVNSTVIADRNSWPIDMKVEEEVVRLWEQVRHQDVSHLVTSLQLSNADIVHLQFNYGFFSMEDLSELINRLQGVKPIVITLHRTKDLDRGHEVVSLAHAANALRKVNAIIVHERHDIARLAEFGISDNVVHIPHAAMPFSGVRTNRIFTSSEPLRIGTFGFMLPHKGLEIALTSIHTLNYRGRPATLKALCSLHPDPSSQATHSKIVDLISRWNLEQYVSLDTSYKSVDEIHTELSDIDVLVLPYMQTEESASGVLAMLLGIGKPIIATDLDIFEGAREVLMTIPSPATSDTLTEALESLIESPHRMTELGCYAQRRAIDISWGAIGRQTAELYKAILHS
jgi:glycosyltransferase involved in cell wall biosynthesis